MEEGRSQVEERRAPILRCGRLMMPTLMNLSDDEIVRIWDGVSQYILRQFALNKGVIIPGLGTFCLIKDHQSMGDSGVFHMQKPVFQLSENFARVHGLQYEEADLPGAVAIVVLNYASVCLDTRIPRDTVQRCVQETLLFLSYTLAKKQDVDFIFKDIGCLRFRKNKVKMRFSADFVRSLDSTGLLLKSLCSRPGTTGSNVSGRRNAPSQTAAGDVVVFPKIGLYVAPGRAAGPGPLQTPKGQVEEKKKGEVRREEEAKRTGSLTDKNRLLSRERLSPARLPRVTVEGELGEAARAKEPPLRLPAVRKESSSRKGEEGKHRRSATARPRTLPPVCEGHRRAGQEVCHLCMQREERNLRASLAEERLQKEMEEERMLAEYHARRQRAWVELMARGQPASQDGKSGVQVAPAKPKQQHLLIPHPPEKKKEAAAGDKSRTNSLVVRGIRVIRVERRKEALQQDRRKSRAVEIPRETAEELLPCASEKIHR